MKWLVAVAAVAACKSPKPNDKDVDWPACEAAIRLAQADLLDARPMRVIAGCPVCGEFAPLLRWNTPHAEGGPTRQAIENAMVACHGYCDADAKQRFLGTLDSARGMAVRTPWLQLGERCKAEVSAIPDARYATAPLFVLDRIARAASAHGIAVAALELPVPAVTLTGAGVVLPEVNAGAVLDAGPYAITVLGDQIFVGRLPRAHLSPSGVAIDLGPVPYPGAQVALAALAGELAKLPDAPVALLAPKAMPAAPLVPIVTAAASVRPIYLAVAAPGSPEGWMLPGTLPIALDAGALAGATVQDVANELAKRVARH